MPVALPTAYPGQRSDIASPFPGSVPLSDYGPFAARGLNSGRQCL